MVTLTPARSKAGVALIDTFDHIRIINLAHRADRREEMAEQLRSVGLSFKLTVSLFPAVRPVDRSEFESIGAHGCFMSHLGVLRESIGKSGVLILEDDANFAAEFHNRVGPAVAALPSGWGIFYGGCRADLPAGSPLVEVPHSTPITLAHFIAISGPVIPRLVAYLEAMLLRTNGDPAGGPMHVDGAYSHFRADNPNVTTFAAVPELAYQRSSRTDIAALHWFDRTWAVRDVVQALRRMRRAS